MLGYFKHQLNSFNVDYNLWQTLFIFSCLLTIAEVTYMADTDSRGGAYLYPSDGFPAVVPHLYSYRNGFAMVIHRFVQ